MKKINLPPQVVREIIEFYKSGNALIQTGEAFGVSRTVIKRILTTQGVPIRTIREANKGQTPWNKGRPHSLTTTQRISAATIGKRTGSNNPNWKGGTSKLFDARRNLAVVKQWRRSCLLRDGCCRWCGSTIRLEVNHITPLRDLSDKELGDVNNGITLCHECHKKIYLKEYQYAGFFKKLLNIV